MPTDPLYNKSVTQNDLAQVKGGAVINIMVPLLSSLGRVTLPPTPPPYWSWNRDGVLRATIFQEAMWAAAVGIAISKVASAGWEVQGEVAQRVKKMRELFIEADGRRQGWVNFISKHLRDYLLTDNGSFVEIVREGKGAGSKIIGIRHLDSLRVTRTGDPDIPALYRDKKGYVHELKDYQIMMFSELPDPGDTYFGVGMSAASRAYPAIYKLNAIETYLREKVSGNKPLAIYIVNGIMTDQLNGAVQVAQQAEVSRGVVGYMGAVIVGIPQDQTPELVTIPLAELPDRFDRKQEFDIAVLTYADVLGLDVQDLQPLTGQALGTGAQSQVLAEKARGKGIQSWRADWIHQIDEYIAPEDTKFVWTEKDWRDLIQKADVSLKLSQVAAARITAQITTPAQELQILVDQNELPKEFLVVDQTGQTNLSDTDSENDADPEKADQTPQNPVQTTPNKTAAQIQAEQRQQQMFEQQQAAKPKPGEEEEKPGDKSGNLPTNPGDDKPEGKKPGRKEELAKMAKKESFSSVIVGLFPNNRSKRFLKSVIKDWPSGAKPTNNGDFHLTLVYLGDSTELGDKNKFIDLVRDFSENQGRISGKVNGIGRFYSETEEADAIYANYDAPGLNELRAKLVSGIGVTEPPDHGFTPHITLGYIPSDAETPEGDLDITPLNFDAITLAWGNERYDFPFQAPTTKEAEISFDQESIRLFEAVKASLGKIAVKGGAGSGNFGHAGRPGEIGGSMTGGQGFSKDEWAGNA